MTNDRTYSTSTTTRMPIIAVATDKVTGTTLLEAAYGGTVRFAKVRATGTLRHWPVLAPGSAARKQADEVMAKRAAKVSVEAIAKSLHKSVPTVRRIITAYAFTLELEAMKKGDLATMAKAAMANMAKVEVEAPAKEEKAAEPAKEAAKVTAKPRAPKVAKAEEAAKVAATEGTEAPAEEKATA